MAPSETARKIQAPTPFIRKKSGIPKNVKVLKRAAAKVNTPSVNPILDPAIMNSSEDRFFLYDFNEAKTNRPA
jgi:hypothetical protein